MSDLLKLHEKYNAVKAKQKWAYARAYLTDVYPGYFEPVRAKVKKVLEIGVCWGGSVLALREYFPNAEIVGADIALEKTIRRAKHSRVTLLQGDQGNPDFLNQLGSLGPYDFIIENIRNQDKINKKIYYDKLEIRREKGQHSTNGKLCRFPWQKEWPK